MLAERMNTFSGSPTSALIAKVAELRAEKIFYFIMRVLVIF